MAKQVVFNWWDHRRSLEVLAGWDGELTAYDLAGALWGDRYGGSANKARYRLKVLGKLGFAKKRKSKATYPHVNYWKITEAGRLALGGDAT